MRNSLVLKQILEMRARLRVLCLSMTKLYNSALSRTIFCNVKWFSTLSLAAFPILLARASSFNRKTIFFTNADGSAAGTRKPVLPSITASGLPPTSVATTGFPAAIDSTTTLENPSLREHITEISNVQRISRMSARLPRNWTCREMPSRVDSNSSSFLVLPGSPGSFPTIIN